MKRQGRKDRHWQHEDTGAVCISWYKPSKRWYSITKDQYEYKLKYDYQYRTVPIYYNKWWIGKRAITFMVVRHFPYLVFKYDPPSS